MSHTPSIAIQMAHMASVMGGGVTLVLSLCFVNRFPTAFFRAWMMGFGLFFLLGVGELVAGVWGRMPGVSLMELVGVSASAWWFWGTGRLARGAERPGLRWLLALLAFGVGMAGAEALGLPFSMAGMPVVLIHSIAMGRLGVVFLRELPGDDAVPGAAWVGWSAIAIALWPWVFPYPLLIHTAFAPMGFVGAGVLQLVIGLSMMFYLADLNWAHYKRTQDQLTRLKTDFVSIVSHELRSPLTTVIGYAEFLEEEIAGPLNPGQQEYLSEIQKGSRRLQRLVDGLLDYSLADGGVLRLNRRETDLVALAHAAVESLRPQALSAGVQLEAILPGTLSGWLDADRIEQVMLNLLSNALKFTPTGGRVTLSLRPDGDQALVEIRDTGIGIALADLPQLFDKFFQVGAGPERARGGAGLGLAIAQAIVGAHGGTIQVASAPGEGTCFTVALRIAKPADAVSVSVVGQESEALTPDLTAS